MMKSETTIKVIKVDKDKITGINMEGENKNKTVDIGMNKSIYTALLVEMKKANIIVDTNLQCFNNRIFTIFEREWKDVPIFGVALRKDIEQLYENSK